MKQLGIPTRAILLVALIGTLYATSYYSYLLFHSITEMFSVVVMISIFSLAWNTRQWMDYNYFLFLGIAFLFVGVIDFLHILAFKGMNIFQGYDANLPTQLWILARYLQSISLLVAPIWFRRVTSRWGILAAFFTVSAISVSLIFTNNFPTCYIEGIGLTKFKIVSEYIIIAILGLAIIPTFKNRKWLEAGARRALFLFIILMIGSEFAFTSYLGVYDEANLIGHILRIIAYISLYNALVTTALQHPFDLVFQNLKQQETDLQRLFDINPFPVFLTKLSGSDIVKANQATLDLFGLDTHDIQNFKASNFYVNIEDREKLLAQLQKKGRVNNELFELQNKAGTHLWCLVNVNIIEFENETCLLTGLAEITEMKRIQEDLRYRSMHDALTEVHNRTFFELELQRLRTGVSYPVSIIAIDIDDMKTVNDTYGHARGDELLQTFARLTQSVLRSGEVFARIGGDEFSILLPNTDTANAKQVMQRIKNQLDSYAARNTNKPIRISIGLGVASEPGNFDEALKIADKNMYADKKFKKEKTQPLRK